MQRTKPRTFYDDYENDCVELWDAIEKLQNELSEANKRIEELELNGEPQDKEEDSR